MILIIAHLLAKPEKHRDYFTFSHTEKLLNTLVIGDTGPTGSHIVKGLLELGYEIITLYTDSHKADLPREVKYIHDDPHF
jgi:hypothetical protein